MRVITGPNELRVEVGVSGRFDRGPRRVQIRATSPTTDLPVDVARRLAVAILEQAADAEQRSGRA